MKELAASKLSVVAVGAHSDDVILQCSGTLASLQKKGAKVIQVIMTTSPSIDHYGLGNTNLKTNRMEVLRSAKIIGMDTRFLDFVNNQIPYSSDSIQTLNKIFDETNASLILTHWIHESQQDHQNTAKSVITAARKYRNILMFEEHIGRPSVSTLAFRPSIYFDISDSLHDKMKAIRSFKSQYDRLGGRDLLKIWEYRAQIRGAEVQVKAAEAFEPVKFLADTLFS